MLQRKILSSAVWFGGALLLACGLSGGAAQAATDPMPGDLQAPPVNINIGLFYNYFSTANEFDPAHGADVKQDTHFSNNITVARYIRLFDVDGYTSGVQVFIPYVAFLGNQHLGLGDLPSAAPGLLPPIGAARANLSDKDGFGQPNFSAFFYPINNPQTGTYAVISPWISPPLSNFNKNDSLSAAQNVWTYELETGFRTTLLGTPTTQNVSVEVWGEGYLYGHNTSSADVIPEVSADNLPPEYAFAHEFIDPAIPGANPISPKTVLPATFREQPTAELRVYLPIQVFPPTRATITPGFYQSFGGKQTYKLDANGEVLDTGNRTNETQFRIYASTFLSHSIQVLAAGYIDVAAHGQPLNRTFVVRLGVFFKAVPFVNKKN